MKSLTELYKIGRGPSSSHTMGPEKAAKLFMERNKRAYSFKVVLYGSLAKTGKGHGTDVVLKKTFTKPVDVVFDYENEHLPHPNTIATQQGQKSSIEQLRDYVAEQKALYSKGPSTSEDRAEANRRRNRKNKLKTNLKELLEKTDSLELKISEVKALMNLHENYSDAAKIGELAKRLEDLEAQKEETELEWISKSEEYENEFGQDE